MVVCHEESVFTFREMNVFDIKLKTSKDLKHLKTFQLNNLATVSFWFQLCSSKVRLTILEIYFSSQVHWQLLTKIRLYRDML